MVCLKRFFIITKSIECHERAIRYLFADVINGKKNIRRMTASIKSCKVYCLRKSSNFFFLFFGSLIFHGVKWIFFSLIFTPNESRCVQEIIFFSFSLFLLWCALVFLFLFCNRQSHNVIWSAVTGKQSQK